MGTLCYSLNLLHQLADTPGVHLLMLGFFALCPPAQVIATLAEKGDIQALIAYTNSTGQKLDYMYLLQSLMMNNPTGGVALAKMISKQVPPPVDVNVMADLFLQVCDYW